MTDEATLARADEHATLDELEDAISHMNRVTTKKWLRENGVQHNGSASLLALREKAFEKARELHAGVAEIVPALTTLAEYEKAGKEALVNEAVRRDLHKRLTDFGYEQPFEKLTKADLKDLLVSDDVQDREIEAIVTAPESDGDMLARLGTDGQLWADEFIKVSDKIGEHNIREMLHVWFANAIEAGRSAGAGSWSVQLGEPLFSEVAYTTPATIGDLVDVVKAGFDQVTSALDPEFHVELQAEQQLEEARVVISSLANEVDRLRRDARTVI